MKKEIFAVRRGNHPLEFMGMPLDAPAIFIKDKEDDDWTFYLACHDNAIVEAELKDLLEKCEVEHFYENSKYFEDGEQLSEEDLLEIDFPNIWGNLV